MYTITLHEKRPDIGYLKNFIKHESNNDFQGCKDFKCWCGGSYCVCPERKWRNYNQKELTMIKIDRFLSNEYEKQLKKDDDDILEILEKFRYRTQVLLPDIFR